MSMHGKTIVVTGATSGIGEVAAIRLAEQGARIVFTARDEGRAKATMAKLKRANGECEHVAHFGDLSLIADQKRVAAAIVAEPRIDVLINNAGAIFNRRIETGEGLEKTFALNHMSYFTITNLLLPRLKETPGARIVSVASGAHRRGKMDFNDLQSSRDYRGFAVYGMSKLCNILFTHALAKRLTGEHRPGKVPPGGFPSGRATEENGVTANCLHPGFVATRFADQSGGWLQGVVKLIKPLGGISPEDGAKTILYLAASPDVAQTSGEYFYQCRIDQPTEEARNYFDAERLWQESVKIAGVG